MTDDQDNTPSYSLNLDEIKGATGATGIQGPCWS